MKKKSFNALRRKLRHLRIAGYGEMGVGEILKMAARKMAPIVDQLETPTHFINATQCDALEEIFTILHDILDSLATLGVRSDATLATIQLDFLAKYRTVAPSNNEIYVDTNLLLQIFELSNVIQIIQRELDVILTPPPQTTTSSKTSKNSSAAQTPSSDIIDNDNNSTLLSSGVSTSLKLANDYVIMPSSVTLTGNDDNDDDSQERRVTDVQGARKILIKCIYDLQDVSTYLGTEKKDVFTSAISSEQEEPPPPPPPPPPPQQQQQEEEREEMADNATIRAAEEEELQAPEEEEETAPEEEETEESIGKVSRKSEEIAEAHSPSLQKSGEIAEIKEIAESPSPKSQQEGRCCCPECFADHPEGAECSDEDQVIICIKGCNDEEGDVQIVIRQCPECKEKNNAKLANAQVQHSPPAPSTPEQRPQKTDESPPSPPPPPPQSQNLNQSVNQFDIFDDGGGEEEEEPKILHNKDSKGSLICSDDEDEEDEENRRRQNGEGAHEELWAAHSSCAQIQMFETTNLCVRTMEGEELMIALTVTPKMATTGGQHHHPSNNKKISLHDIFSDNDSVIKMVKAPPKLTYFVPDKFIPLERTKICSSLDFDVTTATAHSKVRTKGIHHPNNKIIVQLQSFGPDNLLRACRPARCCRRSFLDEKLKKCLPYSASLRSLPLDDSDITVIKQSMNMSVQKVKNTTNLNQNKNDIYSY